VEAHQFLPEIEKLTQTLKAQELSFKVFGLFSDIHTADKTEIDNFGAEKAEHLKVLLQQMIDEKIPLMINGDFFELWQSVFEHIKESYADVFELMRQLPLIVMLPGNGQRADTVRPGRIVPNDYTTTHRHRKSLRETRHADDTP
jgi:hypothetical protein